MKIPKNATAEFFDKQVKDKVFDPIQWSRWVKQKLSKEYFEDPEGYKKKSKEINRRWQTGDKSVIGL